MSTAEEGTFRKEIKFVQANSSALFKKEPELETLGAENSTDGLNLQRETIRFKRTPYNFLRLFFQPFF